MSDKLTSEQLDIMRKRDILLNERLQSVNELITGRSAFLADFINGQDGKNSEEKTDAFISELIDCFKRRRKLEKRRALERNTEEMYRAFLYLAIHGLVDKRIRKLSGFTVLSEAESFADVIGFAEDLEPSGIGDYRDFLIADLDSFISRYNLYKVDRIIPVQGTFGILMYVMRDCMESFVLRGLPRSKQVLLCKEYAERVGLSETKKNMLIEAVMDELYSDPDADGYFEYLDSLIAADRETQRKLYEEEVSDGSFSGTFEEYLELGGPDPDEYEKELEEREAIADAVASLGEEQTYKDSEKLRGYTDEEIEEQLSRKMSDDNWDNSVRWLNALPDTERYCAAYKKFAELYFENDHSGLAGDIEDMIDAFLFEHRLSAFSFGDDYLMINYYFDQFRSRVESELVRGRKK